MAKKRIKNKSRIEAKSENKVLHGLAGSIEEALSEDPSEIEQDEVIVVDVPEHRHKGLAKKIAYFVVGLLIIVFAVVGAVNTVIAISGGIGRIANQTDLKEEFAYTINYNKDSRFKNTSHGRHVQLRNGHGCNVYPRI